jgi:hypothetical protein
MSKSNQAMEALIEVMRVEYGAGPEFELELGVLVGRCREQHNRRMRDAQAADLLHLGRDKVAERLGVSSSTVYKMAKRARRKHSTEGQAA